MNPVRSAAISASLRAYEAWALVEVHHPRGLAPFAVDAYVECGRVNTILSESVYACGILRQLAFPGDGSDTARVLSLRRRYQTLCQAQEATRLEVQVAVLRLFDLTCHMGDDEYLELGVAVNQYLLGQ